MVNLENLQISEIRNNGTFASFYYLSRFVVVEQLNLICKYIWFIFEGLILIHAVLNPIQHDKGYNNSLTGFPPVTSQKVMIRPQTF